VFFVSPERGSFDFDERKEARQHFKKKSVKNDVTCTHKNSTHSTANSEKR
jgi:hypothetical protein